MRGENLTVGTDRLFIIGSPPLARGKLANCCCETREARITPACAVKTGAAFRLPLGFWDHPRLRGENYIEYIAHDRKRGSPPLARGKLIRANASTQHIRITPACAGKTLQDLQAVHESEDHPRLRGENRNAMRLFSVI